MCCFNGRVSGGVGAVITLGEILRLLSLTHPTFGGNQGVKAAMSFTDCWTAAPLWQRLSWFCLAKLWLLCVFVNITKHYSFLDTLLYLLFLQLLKNNHTNAFCSLRYGYNRLQSRSLFIYCNAIRWNLDIQFQTAGNQSRVIIQHISKSHSDLP